MVLGGERSRATRCGRNFTRTTHNPHFITSGVGRLTSNKTTVVCSHPERDAVAARVRAIFSSDYGHPLLILDAANANDQWSLVQRILHVMSFQYAESVKHLVRISIAFSPRTWWPS